MKYVIIRRHVTGDIWQEVPIIFPEILTHKEVADSGTKILSGTVVSAGFCSFLLECAFGKSVSLDIESRKNDLAMMNSYGIHQGIIILEKGEPNGNT